MKSRTMVLVSVCLVLATPAYSGCESVENLDQVSEQACSTFALCAPYHFDQVYSTVEECTAFVLDQIEDAYASGGESCGDAWKAYHECDGNVSCDVYEVESNCPDEDLLIINNCSY